MKKYLLIAGIGLLTAAGVTATVVGSSKKKTTQHTSKSCTHHCSKASRTACY
ncbi:MAG: hypothetical protein ACJ75B_21715 [Flavisolibacter sp.]